MDDLTLTCQDEKRRQAARDKGLNGIDFIVVCCSDKESPSLCVHLFGKGLEKIERANVHIVGGRRIRDIQVLDVDIEHNDDPELEDCLRVRLDKFGDLSTYTLRLVETKEGELHNEPLAGFDPRYSEADFSFTVCCSTDLDCKKIDVCPPEVLIEPEIDYLAKDYSSFRQLILDRLALIMPGWKERHIPDLGIALVEVLAYVGDYLSYYQDAVATEAYLDTARQRISVRRHVRLVDYFIHEGCNARTWVFVWTEQDIPSLDPKEVFFITTPPCLQAGGNVLKAEDLNDIAPSAYEAFEPLVEPELFQLDDLKDPGNLVNDLLTSQAPVIQYVRRRLSSKTKRLLAGCSSSGKPSGLMLKAVAQDWDRIKTGNIYLYQFHSTINFYTWGDSECCLPKGTTRATLKDKYKDSKDTVSDNTDQTQKLYGEFKYVDYQRASMLRLREGDILIFEEVKGPKTGNPADADPAHRQAVRLTKVEPGIDLLYDQPVVEIEWAAEDALKFPLCISSTLPAPECRLLEDVSVARGNVILVDHGRTVDPESLGTVAADVIEGECDCGRAGDATCQAEAFKAILKKSPITFSQKPLAMAPAFVMLSQDPRQALPQIVLTGLPAANGEQMYRDDPKWKWYPLYDLLESHGKDQNFVVEIDNDGRAHLRFGNDELGKMPEANTIFTAVYRVGNGPEGNIGVDTISHLVLRHTTLSGITIQPRNPLPAQGGTLREPLADIKLFAPGAFRKDLQRAITADDYASLARNHGRGLVQNAAAEIRWTGSWYEAEVEVDPFGKEELDDSLRLELLGYLYRFRRMGQDVVVAQAIYVPLDLTLTVCVLPHYLSGHVKAALLDRFSNRQLPDGQFGFFHQDSLTFGEGVAVSKIIAAAQAVPGVESVSAKLKRLGDSDRLAIDDNILKLGPMEIAQLDNDPSFPENGKLTLIMRGGR